MDPLWPSVSQNTLQPGFFSQERAEERAGTANGTTGHLPYARPSHLIVLCANSPAPWKTQPLQTT